MEWARILAYVTGTVDQELLLRSEYLAAENRILKAQSKGRLTLSDTERATLGEFGRRLGRKLLSEVANVARPDTILSWYRKHVARKFDGSKERRAPGRPRLDRAIEELIVRMAQENRDWVSLLNIRFDLGIRLPAKIANDDCLSAAQKIGDSCNAPCMSAVRHCSRAMQVDKKASIDIKARILDRSPEFMQRVVHSDDANHRPPGRQ
jgi:hypothetical protein